MSKTTTKRFQITTYLISPFYVDIFIDILQKKVRSYDCLLLNISYTSKEGYCFLFKVGGKSSNLDNLKKDLDSGQIIDEDFKLAFSSVFLTLVNKRASTYVGN